MERHNNRRHHRWLTEGFAWLDAWDAPPPEGPAVLVADVASFQRPVSLRCRWIGPTATEEQLRRRISEVVGGPPVDGSWAVIDQVGLGSTMLPEGITISALHRIVHQARLQSHRP